MKVVASVEKAVGKWVSSRVAWMVVMMAYQKVDVSVAKTVV